MFLKDEQIFVDSNYHSLVNNDVAKMVWIIGSLFLEVLDGP